MAKFFNIITRATDSEGNSAQENLQVKAGESFAGLPSVSFQFPSVISTQEGDSNNPYWSNTVSRGFAFIGVTPSPSDAGTGGFYVQTYYTSGQYPHSPSRQFKDTAKGDGTTLSSDWFFSTSIMQVEGGGFEGSGLSVSSDISGLRPALVISRDTQEDTPVFNDGVRRIKPHRIGARVPDTDTILMAYHHDLGTDPNQLRTLKVVQEGGEDLIEDVIDDSDDGRGTRRGTVTRVSRTTTGWPAGTFIFPHPYHYCPVYENNSLNSHYDMPYVLVVEDGVQYPLRGTVSVAGTAVTGSYTRFTQEISGQSVIRFEGDTNWYIVSGVLSDSGLVIHDYGNAPSFTNVAAQANRFTIGSGLIEILPNIAGCSDWGIALTPKYNDGDIIPGESLVYSVDFTGTGAISGTPSYQWSVAEQPIGGGTITTSGTGHTSTGTLDVPYDNTKSINVSVTVSGASQPICVHSYETGFLNLQPGANAGTWSANPLANENADGEHISACRWFRREGAGAATDFMHHWQSIAGPPSASVNSTFAYNYNTLALGGTSLEMERWPDQGTIIIHVKFNGDDGSTISRFGVNHMLTYTGKSGSVLTGVDAGSVWTWSMTNNGPTEPTGAGFFNYTTSSYTMTAYLYTPNHWPSTYITGIDSSRTRIKVEDLRRIKEVRFAGGLQKFWILASQWSDLPGDPGTFGFHTNSLQFPYVVELNGFSLSTDELELTEPLPTYFEIGDPIFPGFWDHWRQGSPSRLDTAVPPAEWNLINQSCLAFKGAHNRTDDLTHHGTEIYYDPRFEFDADETLNISVINFIPGAVQNISPYSDWLNNGSLNRITMPKKGKIIILNQDRTKNLVFEYDDHTGFRQDTSGGQGSGSDWGYNLANCRLVEDESGSNAVDSNGKIRMNRGQLTFTRKELYVTGEHTIETTPGDDPHIIISQPGQRTQVNYANACWYDLIQSNLTSGTYIGIEGTPKAENLWEDSIDNWPSNAIAQVDPIYTDVPDALPPDDDDQDPWWWWWFGCIHEDALVRIQDRGKICIGDVQEGDMILARSGVDDGWYEVTSTLRTHHTSGMLKFTFTNAISGSTMQCTSRHPLAKETPSGVEWTRAEDIIVGDVLKALMDTQVVAKIEEVTEPGYYIDLTVDTAETFFVGYILVHNKRHPWTDYPYY